MKKIHLNTKKFVKFYYIILLKKKIRKRKSVDGKG